MSLDVEVVARTDLSFAIEKKSYSDNNISLYDFLCREIEGYDDTKAKTFDVLCDGVVIREDCFKIYNLKDTKSVKIVIEPRLTGWVIASLIIAIASFAYSMYMMSKIKNNNQASQQKGTSIYDVNAQGNKVKLGDIIPENFGTFKRFPDYIADNHIFYKNNVQYMDISLSQGVGRYQRKGDFSDVYIGNSPLSNLPNVECEVFEPGATTYDGSRWQYEYMSDDHGRHLCWYNCPEVNNISVNSKIKQSSQWTVFNYTGFYVCPGEEQKKGVIGAKVGDIIRISNVTNMNGVNTSRILHPYQMQYNNNIRFNPKKWTGDPDALFIGNSSAIDKWCMSSSSDYCVMADGIEYSYLSTFYVETLDEQGQPTGYVNYVISSDYWAYDTDYRLHHAWCDTKNYYGSQSGMIAYDTSDNNDMHQFYRTCIRPNQQVWVKARLRAYLQSTTDPNVGYWWYGKEEIYRGHIRDDASSRSYDGWIGRQGVYIDIDDGQNQPLPHLNVAPNMRSDWNVTSMSIIWYAYEGNLSDGYASDNGYYKIMKIRKPTYSYFSQVWSSLFRSFDDSYYSPSKYMNDWTFYDVVRCDSDGNIDNNWLGFRSFNQALQGVSIVAYDAKETSEVANIYRSQPIGCPVDRCEVDISFPQGLYRVNTKTGDYERQDVSVVVQYKRADLIDEPNNWTSFKYDYYNNKADELAFTYEYKMPSKSEWEWRVYRTTSESDESTVIDKCKFVGLKSIIARPTKYDDMTTIFLRIRGNESLSSASNNQISTIWTRKLPNIDSGILEPTDNIAPALKYVVNSCKYPSMLKASDLQSYADYWALYGMKLNGTLDNESTLFEVLQSMMQVGMSEPTISNNQICIKSLSKHSNDYSFVFQPQNVCSMPEMCVTFPKSDDIDEVVVEFTDPVTFKTKTIYIQAYNNDTVGRCKKTYYPTSQKQDKMSLWGVTDEELAFAIGCRRFNHLRYHKTTYSVKTELDSMYCEYGDYVGISLANYTHKTKWTNRVVGYDSDTKELSLQNVLKWESTQDRSDGINLSTATTRAVIRSYDGTQFNVGCSYSVDNDNYYHIILNEPLPFTFDSRFGSEWEYPIINFYELSDTMPAVITEVNLNGKTIDVKARNYDNRLFYNDLEPREGYGVTSYGSVYGTYY